MSFSIDMKKILVTGAGGFIGSHLVADLKSRGHYVCGVDLKNPEFKKTEADEFHLLDLREKDAAEVALESMGRSVDEVYALAADMGGMGFISSHHAEIFYNNSLINLHTIQAAKKFKVKRYLFSSSACVYPGRLQTNTDAAELKESDAYPAQPEDGYGWEKLFSERLCHYYEQDYGLKIRIARFHNIFGPYGTWQGGREKAPAALCRKIAEAKLAGVREIELWGDGRQTRSFCYIDDCVTALVKLMASDYSQPLNIGQNRAVTIDWLAFTVSVIANWLITLKHVPGPQGVRGRNSNNELAEKVLDGWTPVVGLEEGLIRTYGWIEEQVQKKLKKEKKQNPGQVKEAV